LLLRRHQTGYQDGNYSVVAGHLNGGEPVVCAAVREAREEVGITVAPEALEVVGVMHRLSDDERIDFFLVASSWMGRIRNEEPEKCDQVAWFDVERLPQNVIPYVRRALENSRKRQWDRACRGGIWFDTFGWPEGRGQVSSSQGDSKLTGK